MGKIERMQPVHSITYDAWRVLSDKTSQRLGYLDAGSMDEAADLVCRMHGERGRTFLIREEDSGRNEATIRVVQIKKKSRPQRKWCSVQNKFVDVGAEYPVTVTEFRVGDFAPLLPFDALTDDPVGIDRTLVEARP